MKTLRGTTITDKGCLDPVFNIFYAKLDDGRNVTFRQPRRGDSTAQKKAWKQISAENKLRYIRRYETPDLYNMNKRCKIPLYEGEFPGILPLTIEVDQQVVGFSDIFFKMGDYFQRFKVEPEDKCANGSIIVLDKFQGLGIGYMYSEMSDYIARHYDCKYILGRTFASGGMRSIRARDDWEIIWTDGVMVDHKKLL